MAKKNSGFKVIDLTQGSIAKGLLSYFFPILFGAFFQQLYNTVDAIVVGNFVGKQALAAVGGSAAQIINLLIGFFGGLASGATVIIAQYYGAKNNRNIKTSLHTTMMFSLLSGLFLTLFGILVAPSFLRFLKVPEDTMTYSTQYIRVIFMGVIPGFIYNMGAGILRAMGDSKRPLYLLIICCVTNIILDLLFVVVFRMEVLGVAAATSLSQLLSAVLLWRTLTKLDDSYALRLKDLALHKKDLGLILRIGFPSAIQSSMYSISNLLIQTFVNEYGTDTVAAWTAQGKVDAIFWMIMNAFGATILTFVGQNMGAGQIDRAKKGVKTCLAMTIGSAVSLSVLLLVFAKFLLGIFTSDAEVIRLGTLMMTWMVPAYFMWAFVEILPGAMRGSGDAFFPMIITVVGICVLRIVWLFVATPIWPRIETVCLSYPITWVVTGIAFIIYYLKRGLKTRAL